MKKVTILVVAMLALSASLAAAQVNFYINDCGAASTTNSVTNTCTSNTGTVFAAFGSIYVPTVTRVGFVGAMSIVDVISATATLPDWWDGFTCRPAGFTLASDAGMGGSCPTLWDAVPPAGNNITVQTGAANSSLPGPNRVRFLLGVVLDAGNAYDLTGDGTTETSVFKWSVLRGKSVGTGACAGCATGACIVLNEVNLQTLSDTPDTFVRLTTPIANNYINYNSFSGAVCPDAVPVKNRTWGAVKALYR